MMKLLTTLMRGAVAEAEEAAFDANAIRVLTQQLREAAASLEHAKAELACAMAYRAGEHRAVAMLNDRVETLEQGAVDAINGGRSDLAEDAATVIAAIEDERTERQVAISRLDADIMRLQRLTEDGHRRLRELRRGLEMARAQEALARAGANGRRALASGTGALREAEATLSRIKMRQTEANDVDAAMETLQQKASGADLDQRLASAGFGRNLTTRPADVLARVAAKAAAAKSASAARAARPSQPAQEA